MASIVKKRNNDNKKQKQLTLGAFNFTKTITHRNREESVEIPKIARIGTKYIKYPNCDKSFVNNQELSVHLKCFHSSSHVNNQTFPSQSTMVARKQPTDSVLVEMRCVLSEVVGKVAGNDTKARAAMQQARKKRHQYSATFKAKVINMMGQPGNNQESVAEHFQIDQSQVSRYL